MHDIPCPLPACPRPTARLLWLLAILLCTRYTVTKQPTCWENHEVMQLGCRRSQVCWGWLKSSTASHQSLWPLPANTISTQPTQGLDQTCMANAVHVCMKETTALVATLHCCLDLTKALCCQQHLDPLPHYSGYLRCFEQQSHSLHTTGNCSLTRGRREGGC
jgi:hypothetical protein